MCEPRSCAGVSTRGQLGGFIYFNGLTGVHLPLLNLCSRETSEQLDPVARVFFFGDELSNDWIGKPVTTGERIAQLAQPDDLGVLVDDLVTRGVTEP